MKQYIKNKPIKWGFKVWERCGAYSAYLYKFDIYTGRKNQPGLGLGEQVILQLTRSLQNSNIRIFCDNYFTSPALCTALLNNGIYLTGVVRPNRKNMPEFRNDKDMARGDIEVKNATNAPIICVKWVDNKSVHLISSCDDVFYECKTEREKVNQIKSQ